jgi:acylglycerol lipase
LINKSSYFEGRENKRLFYQYWLPESDPIKANIIAMHGWGTHSDRMNVPAEFLTQNGYGVYAFDIRGHWRNTGETPGHIDSMDHVQKDVVLFMDEVKAKDEQKKIFLMGHSFGGLISLIYAIEHPGLPGVIVSSPLLELRMDSSLSKKVGKVLTKPFSKISPTKTISLEIEQNYLTSDLKILRQHISDDKKLKTISLSTAAEMQNSMKWAMENATRLFCPVLILQAGNDKIANPDITREFFDKIKGEDKRFKIYDGFLHELWNEKGRAQVFQDMYVWLEKHL